MLPIYASSKSIISCNKKGDQQNYGGKTKLNGLIFTVVAWKILTEKTYFYIIDS